MHSRIHISHNNACALHLQVALKGGHDAVFALTVLFITWHYVVMGGLLAHKLYASKLQQRQFIPKFPSRKDTSLQSTRRTGQNANLFTYSLRIAVYMLIVFTKCAVLLLGAVLVVPFFDVLLPFRFLTSFFYRESMLSR